MSPTRDEQKLMEYLLKLLLPLKNFIYLIASGFITFVIPLAPLVVVTTSMALLDWAIKIYCITRSQGRRALKSNKMADTFHKIILYAVFLFVLYVVDLLFVKTFLLDIAKLLINTDGIFMAILSKGSLIGFGTCMVLYRETLSIDENWEEAFGISFIKVIKEKFNWIPFRWKDNEDTLTKK